MSKTQASGVRKGSMRARDTREGGTRERILVVAKELFNDRGFNAVSTRDIADALGISKGNLTYHFKKKEDIVEALVLERGNQMPSIPTPRNLEELDYLFIHMYDVVQENAFYFWHHTQLGQLSARVRDAQIATYRKNVELLGDALRVLDAEGLIISESYEGQFRSVTDSLLMICMYWVPYLTIAEESTPKNTPHDFRDQIWSILFPLLTTDGLMQYHQLQR